MKKRLFYEAPEAEPLEFAVEVRFLDGTNLPNGYGESKRAAQDFDKHDYGEF